MRASTVTIIFMTTELFSDAVVLMASSSDSFWSSFRKSDKFQYSLDLSDSKFDSVIFFNMTGEEASIPFWGIVAEIAGMSPDINGQLSQ